MTYTMPDHYMPSPNGSPVAVQPVDASLDAANRLQVAALCVRLGFVDVLPMLGIRS